MAARTIGEQIHPEHSTHPEIGRRLPPLHDPPSFHIGMSPHSNVKRINLPGRDRKRTRLNTSYSCASSMQTSAIKQKTNKLNNYTRVSTTITHLSHKQHTHTPHL